MFAPKLRTATLRVSAADSLAPMSHAVPCGRTVPSMSVPLQPLPPASMVTLPGTGLSAVSSVTVTPGRSVGWFRPQVRSDAELAPDDVRTPSQAALPPTLPVIMVPMRFTEPATIVAMPEPPVAFVALLAVMVLHAIEIGCFVWRPAP